MAPDPKSTAKSFTPQSRLTPERTSVSTNPYTQAQKTSDPTTFNINMIHTNPPPNFGLSGTLSRHSIQTSPTNPLQYNLSSTNTHRTQHSIYSLEHNSQTVTSNISAQQNKIPVPSSSSFRTNPCFTPFSQIPSNTKNLRNKTSHSNNHITHPYAQPSTTISNPAYMRPSASISEPINQFDGLNHNYTPEEYLQHIEARATFPSGLQPTASPENKFWHARRMAFIQCSPTGTALSWNIRLNDT